MKRYTLHIIFWLAYIIQDSLLVYLSITTQFTGLGIDQKLWMATMLCLVLLPPKMIFTYLLLYYILPGLSGSGTKKLQYAVRGALLLVAAIVGLRYMAVSFAYPWLIPDKRYWHFFSNPFSFLFTLVDIGYVSGIAIAIKQFRIQLQLKEREKQLLKEKLETELKFLRNQTNPHFLFNTLNNIYGLARKKSDNTAEVVMRLSKLLRYMIYETQSKFITIGLEIKMIEDYISLEEIRYTRGIKIQFNQHTDNTHEPITPLLLLPFVENAFKHGVGESRFESFIFIALHLQEGRLAFSVENSKEDNPGSKDMEPIGLANVKRQLELLYPDYSLEVVNDPNRFKVVLTVNVRRHENI